MSMIRVENLSKSFGSLHVLKDVNLTVEKGERIVIIGGSGCGKSVFLRCMDLLEKPDAGRVFIMDEELTAPKADLNRIRRRVGMVYQGFHLFSHLNVMDNIFLGKPCSEDNRKLLETLQIDHILDHYPDELSGGQKQRVGIARALISEPGMICCDEPTESLDIENRQIVMHLLKEYSKDHIVIMATHQKDAVEQYADYVITIEDHSLLTTVLHETDGVFAKEKYLRIDQKNIRHMMRKITWKKNILFIVIFSVLLMLSQGSSILKQIMFQIPDTTDTLNMDMIYVRADSQESLKQAGEVVGNHTRVKIVKNKVAPPFKEAEFDIMFGQGISMEGDILDLAANVGIINKSGAWYAYEGEKIGQGRENAKAYLKQNKEFCDMIEAKVREHYFAHMEEGTVSEDEVSKMFKVTESYAVRAETSKEKAEETEEKISE